MESIELAISNEKYNEIMNDSKELTNKSHDILKVEWERVKRGEPLYNIAKYTFYIIIIISAYSIKWYLSPIIFLAFVIFLIFGECIQKNADEMIDYLRNTLTDTKKQ